MKHKFLVPAMASLGGLGGLLHLWLRLSRDAQGLLPRGHAAVWGLLLCAAAAFGIVLVLVPRQKGSHRYEHNFFPSTAAMAGCFALAAGLVLTALAGVSQGGLVLLRSAAALPAALALVLTGLARKQGKMPPFLCQALVLAWFALLLVSCYRPWSGEPQLLSYGPTLGAGVCLLLFSYYQTAFCAGLGRRRMQLATGLLALFFCLTALAGGAFFWLCLTGALYAATNLCALTPQPEVDEHVPS